MAASAVKTPDVIIAPIKTELPAVPNAPTGLVAAATTSTGTGLSWQAATVSGLGTVSGYIIYENGTQIATTSGTSYAVTGLSGYVDYSFTVAAVDALGTSPQSTAVSVTTAPIAPAALTAASTTSSSTTLSWDPQTTTGDGGVRPEVLSADYLIYENGTLIYTTEAEGYTVNQLPASANVTFAVVAQNATGNSPQSTISVTTGAAVLNAPTAVAASQTTSSTTNLSWQAPSVPAGTAVTGYAVYVNGAFAGSTTGTSYVVSGLNGSSKYSLSVVAEDAQGDSAASAAVSVTTPVGIVTDPTQLSATNTASSGTSLSWQASSVTGGGAVADYIIYQNGVQIGTSNTTNYVVTGLAGNTSYNFTVAAADAEGDAATSAPLAVTTTVAVPNAPVGLVATATNSSITLNWQAPPVPSGGYSVIYNVYENGQLVQSDSGATSFSLSGLPASTTYDFAVTAADYVGASPPSTISVTTAAGALNAPTGLAAKNTSSGETTLTWQAPTVPGGGPITDYVLYENGVQIGTSATNSILVTNLTAATTYSFAVFAADAAGDSVLSTPISVTTSAATLAAPTGLNTPEIASSESVTIAWQAPTVPGGGSPTDYVIYENGAEVGVSTTNSYHVDGLTQLTTYSFTVVAEAGAAASAMSAPLSVSTLAIGPKRDAGDGGGGDAGGGGDSGGGSDGGSGDGGGGESNAVSAPNAAGALSASGTTSTGTNLSWQAATVPNSGGVVTDYLVYENGAQIGSTSTTSFAVSGLTPSTAYSFTVIAEDDAGTSPAATAVAVTTALAAPNTPAGLAASGTTSSGTSLSWQAASIAGGGSITDYVIYLNGAQLATTTGTSYAVSGLTGSTSYSFAIAAEDAAGDSPTSASISVTTPLAVPNPPSGLAASGTTSGQTTLSWQAATIPGGGTITDYVIYLNGSQLTTTTGTSYTVSGLTGSTSYNLAIVAEDAAGDSAVSAALSVTTPLAVPNPPTGLIASSTTSSGTTLNWQPAVISGGGTVAGYVIYENGTQIGTATTTSYTVSGLSGSTNYNFSVAAQDSAGTSPAGASFGVTTSTGVPSAPAALAAAGTTSNSTTLSWSAATVPGGSAVSGYTIYENGVKVAAATATSYTVTGLSGGTSYGFTVAADDAAGESPQSAAVSVTTSAPAPNAPTGLTLSGTTSQGTTLNWQAASVPGGGTVTGYVVYENGAVLANSATTSYSVTGLKGATAYSFTVAAVDAAGASSQSTAISVTTAPVSTATVTTLTGTTPTATTTTGTTPTSTTTTGTTPAATTATGTTPTSTTTTGTTPAATTATGTTPTSTTATGTTPTSSTATGTTPTSTTATGTTPTSSTATGTTSTSTTATGTTPTSTSTAGTTPTSTTGTGTTPTSTSATGTTATGTLSTGTPVTGTSVTGTGMSTAVSQTLSISGMPSSQSVTDAATLVPLATVSVNEPNPGQTETVTVTVSAPANGTLSNLGGGSFNATTGVYSLAGSVSAVQQALQGLIFTPTAQQVVVGQSVTTSLTLADTDSAGATASATTSVVATAVAAAQNDVTTTKTASGYQYVAGDQSDAITTMAGVNNAVFLGAGQDTVNSAGTDTIIGGTGAETISATANATMFAKGPLTFTNGSGSSIAIMAGQGSITGGTGTMQVYGGNGTLNATGGALGGNALVASGGNATLVGGGNNDIFVGGVVGTTDNMTAVGTSAVFAGAANVALTGGPGQVIVIGGSGSMTITNGSNTSGYNALFGNTGQTVINDTTGNDFILGGAGTIFVNQGSGLEWIVLGSGNIAVNEGPGADIISLFDGQAGGTLSLSGYKLGVDKIYMSGYSAGEQATALANASSTQAGTVLSFSDGTHVIFAGLSSVNSSVFG